jgi:hypothetical protein
MGGGGGGGFLNSVVNTVTNPIGAIGGAIGGGAGRDVGNSLNPILNPIGAAHGAVAAPFMQEHTQAPEVPGEDPRLAAIRKQQGALADQFRTNRSQIENDSYNNIADPERKRLAQQMKTTGANYNNRGLLFSGLRQGAQAKEEAQSGANLAGARQDINRGAEEQQKQLDSSAANAELSQYQTQGAIQDNIYNQALTNMMGRNAVMNGIGGAIGAGAGSYFGRRA